MKAGVDTEKNRMSNMFLAAPAAACGGGSDPFGNLPLKLQTAQRYYIIQSWSWKVSFLMPSLFLLQRCGPLYNNIFIPQAETAGFGPPRVPEQQSPTLNVTNLHEKSTPERIGRHPSITQLSWNDNIG